MHASRKLRANGPEKILIKDKNGRSEITELKKERLRALQFCLKTEAAIGQEVLKWASSQRLP